MFDMHPLDQQSSNDEGRICNMRETSEMGVLPGRWTLLEMARSRECGSAQSMEREILATIQSAAAGAGVVGTTAQAWGVTA